MAANRTRDIILASIALIFTAITTALLVGDLEHKARFLRVVFTPQSRSWLARGAFILIAYSGLSALFCFGAFFSVQAVTSLLLWPTVVVGFLAAVYTAFLFGQCEGRDLWQTPLLPVHLLVQAFLCGAAVLSFLPERLGGSVQTVRVSLLGSVALHLIIVAAEFLMPHSTDNSAYAARLITHGSFRGWFWFGAIIVGCLVPIVLLTSGASLLGNGIAAVMALLGLLAFEWCFVMAGQSVPNS